MRSFLVAVPPAAVAVGSRASFAGIPQCSSFRPCVSLSAIPMFFLQSLIALTPIPTWAYFHWPLFPPMLVHTHRLHQADVSQWQAHALHWGAQTTVATSWLMGAARWPQPTHVWHHRNRLESWMQTEQSSRRTGVVEVGQEWVVGSQWMVMTMGRSGDDQDRRWHDLGK